MSACPYAAGSAGVAFEDQGAASAPWPIGPTTPGERRGMTWCRPPRAASDEFASTYQSDLGRPEDRTNQRRTTWLN